MQKGETQAGKTQASSAGTGKTQASSAGTFRSEKKRLGEEEGKDLGALELLWSYTGAGAETQANGCAKCFRC